jgi:hypothetical protein
LIGSKFIASAIIKISALTFNFGPDGEWFTMLGKKGKEEGKINLSTVWQPNNEHHVSPQPVY